MELPWAFGRCYASRELRSNGSRQKQADRADQAEDAECVEGLVRQAGAAE
jgi:hypothetical protein